MFEINTSILHQETMQIGMNWTCWVKSLTRLPGSWNGNSLFFLLAAHITGEKNEMSELFLIHFFSGIQWL